MNSFQLKLLASLCMLLDHIGVVFFEARLTAAGYELLTNMLLNTPLAGISLLYTALRLIGRLAFPLYAYQLAEGTQHTRNTGRYLLRLALFALLSELPFDLALQGGHFTWQAQNVYWTLLLGAGAIFAYQRTEQSIWLKWTGPLAAAATATLLRTDYGWYGVLVILLFFLIRQDSQKRAAWVVIPLAMQVTAPLALLPITHANGEKGRGWKWPFYLFYPVHLLALYALRLWLAP